MTVNPPTKLCTLAGDIRRRLEAADHAALHQLLPHGLQLVMQRKDRCHWRLALAREGAYPSATEIDLCRRAFAVPDAADLTHRKRVFRHPKSHRRITYFVAELTWIEHDVA